jgi:site-specific recombinase XerD
MSDPSILKLPELIRQFFCQRLCAERHLSSATVASYRDSFCLLLEFVAQDTGQPHSKLQLEDLAAPLILKFLDHLETQRGNTVRTRNARLAAIHTFMRYVAQQEPTALALSTRVLAIPSKRFDRPLLGYLSDPEMQSLLDAPDWSTWTGRRDALLWELLYRTGGRVSEIVALNRQDVQFGEVNLVQLHGKGRKQRAVVLHQRTAARLKQWLEERAPDPLTPLFTNHNGKRLSRFGVIQRLRVSVQKAQSTSPSLKGRKISPHTFRHYADLRTMPIRVASWLFPAEFRDVRSA